MTTEKIIEKFNTLYRYYDLLPKNNKDEFISDLNKLFEYVKQDIPHLNISTEVVENRDIPVSQPIKHEETESYSFNDEVDAKLAQRIMQKIMAESAVQDQVKTEIIEEEKIEEDVIEFSTDIVAPEITKKKDTGKLFIKPDELVTEKTLYSVTKILIPNLTIKGRNVLDYKVGSERISSLLKLIDEKSSVADLYNLYSYNYDNYIEFLNILNDAQKDELVKFIKIEDLDRKAGWIKIGQLLVESNVVHKINITNALNYRKNKKMLIGEVLLELMFVDKQTLDDSLKIQSWLSELVETSVFIDGIIPTEGLTTNSESVSNIFDFIIPVLTSEAKENLMKSDKSNISALNEILDGESSLLSAFENNRKHFKNDRFLFFKLIQTLESQLFLAYVKNDKVKERTTHLRFGELVINLGLANKEQIEETFVYRQNNQDRKMLIGETLVELGYLDPEKLQNCLNIQIWANNILSKISYENSFIHAIKEVLEDYFKITVNIGKFIKKSFNRPLRNMICITYTFTGELNGQIYYIFDGNFVERLTKTILSTYGMESAEIDESIISELCNMITGNSLSKLSKQSIFCEAGMPEISINKEVIIADQQPVSILPLTSEHGRFIVGFNLT